MDDKPAKPHSEAAARFIKMLNRSKPQEEFTDTTVQDILDMVAHGLLKPDDIILMAEEHAILESIRRMIEIAPPSPP